MEWFAVLWGLLCFITATLCLIIGINYFMIGAVGYGIVWTVLAVVNTFSGWVITR